MVGGGGSPDHFFYKMTWGEAAACLRGLNNKERVEWERTRRIMYAALKPYSKELKKYKDAMPLPWDNEITDKEVEIDEKELDRIRELAKSIEL